MVREDNTILKIERLVKSFGGLRAVNGCSIQVFKNTITGLIGPNGAGKTTLFNLISGLYKPDGGAIFFNGERIDGLPPSEIFKKGIYRTFQIPRELKLMTVLENLMLIPSGQWGENLFNTWFLPHKVRRQEKELKEKALEVLKFVNLLHLKDEYAMNLSVGQKKLLELAKAMMAEAKLLLLDEPGAGINPALLKELVFYLIKLVEERSITIFLIEHDMNLVMNICRPIIVISQGEKIAEGSPEEIKKDPRVLEAYLGG